MATRKDKTKLGSKELLARTSEDSVTRAYYVTDDGRTVSGRELVRERLGRRAGKKKAD